MASDPIFPGGLDQAPELKDDINRLITARLADERAVNTTDRTFVNRVVPQQVTAAQFASARGAREGDQLIAPETDGSKWVRRYNGASQAWEYIGGGPTYISATQKSQLRMQHVYNNWGAMPVPITTNIGSFVLDTSLTYRIFYCSSFFTTVAASTVGTQLIGTGVTAAALANSQMFLNNALVHTSAPPYYIEWAGTTIASATSSANGATIQLTQATFGVGVASDGNDIYSVNIAAYSKA